MGNLTESLISTQKSFETTCGSETNPKMFATRAPPKGMVQVDPLNPHLPLKRLYTPQQLREWLSSQAYHGYMDFVITVNHYVKGIPSSYKNKEKGSLVIESFLKILHFLDQLVDDTPLEKKVSLQRFGNPGYRTFFDKLQKEKKGLIYGFFKDSKREPKEFEVVELATYLGESFGNRTRIDYGSGHEAAFGFLLCCVEKLEMYKGRDDYIMIVTRVFRKYLDIVRKIQVKYKLEPAGSHGCWGLDDFQFLPFLWGSSQIVEHKEIRPEDIMSDAIHKKYKNENLYFDAISYINSVKKGPFHEHSGILYSLTSCPHWKKINGGMIKMYVAEVMKKYVVVQHFLFGKLIPWEKYDGEDKIRMYL